MLDWRVCAICRALRAEFDLTRRGAGVHVSGRVQAQVGQTCVVSLEPIENAVDETVDVLFTPGAAAGGDELAAEPGVDGRDPPEPLVDGIIDLGALATEFLLLGIDPYPRKAGAEFAAPKVEDAGERPFAALEALKKRLGPAVNGLIARAGERRLVWLPRAAMFARVTGHQSTPALLITRPRSLHAR